MKNKKKENDVIFKNIEKMTLDQLLNSILKEEFEDNFEKNKQNKKDIHEKIKKFLLDNDKEIESFLFIIKDKNYNYKIYEKFDSNLNEKINMIMRLLNTSKIRKIISDLLKFVNW